MSSHTEQIKAKLPIAEVVGSYIKLEKAGGNYKARCPFHNEKTPSFYVSPSRDSYHCFGCDKGGDIFSFVEEIEGVDFLGALEVLAGRAGVELRPVDLKVRSEKERLYALLEEAARYFHTNLLLSAPAKDYLKKRGVKEETVRSFRIGFAKPEWSDLSAYLLRKGFREDEIEKAGLSIRSSQSVRHAGGRYYDRFRGRIMFPLCDTSGRVVGFSGRIIIQSPSTSLRADDSASHQEAKYINTPQTPLYDKSRVLFGYDRAKQEIRKQDLCVLVEGQMDLVMSHQAGVTNAVAVSGTALTSHHLGLIKRLTDQLVMAFDGDAAGIKAARRGIELALEAGLDVRIALLPDGLDPADLASEDGDRWGAAIAAATNVVDFYLAALGRAVADKRALNKRIVDEILPYVARYPNTIDRAQFVSKIAAFAGVKEEPIWAELEKVRVVADEPAAPDAGAKVSRADLIERKIFGLFFWLSGEHDPLVEELRARLEDFYEGKMSEKIAVYEPIKDQLLLEADLSYRGSEFLKTEIDELLTSQKGEEYRNGLELVLADLRQAEARGDEAAASELLSRARELRKAIENLKN